MVSGCFRLRFSLKPIHFSYSQLESSPDRFLGTLSGRVHRGAAGNRSRRWRNAPVDWLPDPRHTPTADAYPKAG